MSFSITPSCDINEQIKKLPLAIQNIVMLHIEDVRYYNLDDKAQYINDIANTYHDFVEALATSYLSPDDKICIHRVTGIYNECHNKIPSVTYWKECNPGKIVAIDTIMTDLTSYGWSPIIDNISNNELIITCDFRE